MTHLSRVNAVEMQINQLTHELRTHERALSQCLINLSEDPTNEDLRKERQETSAQAARLRQEIADMERAKAHAQRLDAGLERDTLLDTCAMKSEEARAHAQKRVEIAAEIMESVQMLIVKKKEYDEVDEQCHVAFCGAMLPLVGHDRFLSQTDLQGGRLAIPLFDELMRTIVLHVHQQPPLVVANWRSAYMSDAMDRELKNANAAKEPA